MTSLPFFFYAMMAIAALSLVFIALTFLKLTKTLVFSAESLRQLIDDADSRIKQNLDSLNKSISDVNTITSRLNSQMDRVDNIVKNVEQTTEDARSTVRLVESTIVPLFSNMYSVVSGVKRGIDVWRAGRAPRRGDEAAGED